MFPGKFLIVEDNVGMAGYIKLLLDKEKHIVDISVNGKKALSFLKNCHEQNKLPDIVITDLSMPEMDGYTLIKKIRDNFPCIYVIVLTGINDSSLSESFKLGAVDYLEKPFDKNELLVRVKNVLKLKRTEQTLKKALSKLSKYNKKLKSLTVTDELTGVYNRRFFYEQLERSIYKYDRFSTPFCLTIIDLDFLNKKINDNYGHLSGDKVLCEIAELLSRNQRKSDIVTRLGGDEFALILENTALSSAVNVIERSRLKIKELSFDFSKETKITVSAGIFEFDGNCSLNQIVLKTDKKLYRAKQNGRDRIEY
ncbi:MAG: diguanylate cyclase [Victivallales bacterium]|nr:diguanylate cyclase [Victivallales bacterium]